MGTGTDAFLDCKFPEDWVDQGARIHQDFLSSTVSFLVVFLLLESTDLLVPGGLGCTFHTGLSVLPCKFSTQKDKTCRDEWVVMAELCCRVFSVLHSALWWMFVFTSFRIHNDSIFSAFPQRYPLHMKAKSTRSVELISY